MNFSQYCQVRQENKHKKTMQQTLHSYIFIEYYGVFSVIIVFSNLSAFYLCVCDNSEAVNWMGVNCSAFMCSVLMSFSLPMHELFNLNQLRRITFTGIEG